MVLELLNDKHVTQRLISSSSRAKLAGPRCGRSRCGRRLADRPTTLLVDSLLVCLLINHWLLLRSRGREGWMDYSFSCALLFLVPPLNSVWHPRSTGCSFSHGWSVQERLRMDSATTCAHCSALPNLSYSPRPPPLRSAPLCSPNNPAADARRRHRRRRRRRRSYFTASLPSPHPSAILDIGF